MNARSYPDYAREATAPTPSVPSSVSALLDTASVKIPAPVRVSVDSTQAGPGTSSPSLTYCSAKLSKVRGGRLMGAMASLLYILPPYFSPSSVQLPSFFLLLTWK